MNGQDLQTLVEAEVRENHDVEYKRAMLGPCTEKINFLAGVSCFANAGGGDLLLGIRAERGVAKELVGLDTTDADATILKLDNLIRDGIKPRITGIQLHPLQISSRRWSQLCAYRVVGQHLLWLKTSLDFSRRIRSNRKETARRVRIG
jgi:predicted HTH transcriptional regulator